MNLAKAYTPNDYEPTIYAMWEKSGVFAPKGEGEPYAIVMPPPNANGNLHVGHALGSAIQDILVRYHRMQGYDAVYIPKSKGRHGLISTAKICTLKYGILWRRGAATWNCSCARLV